MPYVVDEAKLSYKTLVYGGNFMGGIELQHYFKVGLGLSYLYYKQYDSSEPSFFRGMPFSSTTHGIPLFLHLRSNFLDKKISPYMDLKVGNNFLITKEEVILFPGETTFGKFRLKNGLYLASNIGIAFKATSNNTINISVGYQYVSRNHDTPYNFGWRGEEYYKTGHIIVDHQFLFNVGVSF